MKRRKHEWWRKWNGERAAERLVTEQSKQTTPKCSHAVNPEHIEYKNGSCPQRLVLAEIEAPASSQAPQPLQP